MTFGRPKDDGDSNKTPSAFQFGVGALGKQGSENVEAFLGKGSKVTGTLNFSGPVELDGQVEGEIFAQDRLIIGEGAVINARINGSEILVKGNVNGDISASKRLALKRPARVIGNISCANLSIEEGVIFEGKSSMNSPKTTELKPVSSQKLGPSEKIGLTSVAG